MRLKRFVKKLLVREQHSYQQWINVNEPRLWSQEKINKKPLISIVVPAFNTPDKYLKPLIDSFINQKYPDWELCLVDASNSKERIGAIKKITEKDKRIIYLTAPKNEGIAANTNIGIKAAKGEYIGFTDHDDMLSPYALSEVAVAINKHPDAELIYSDEDKLSDDGKERSLPFFKPDWSPQLVEGVNYLAHLVVVRRGTIEKLNGLRKGFDGAQDYDFILRASELTDKIYHIPKILYHWRMADGSTARAIGEKNYADEAGQKALKDHVGRTKTNAKVVGIPERPTNYRLKYNLPKQTKVSIIIPFKDKSDYLKRSVGSILEKTINTDYEIILISNNSEESSTKTYLKEVSKNNKVKVLTWDKPFNYSAVNNFGRTKASGNYLVFLNNDTEVINEAWLEELVSVAAQPDTGAVGALLLYPNNKIQHAGVVLGMKTMAGHPFRYREESELTELGLPCWPRNYLAVTGACLAISAKKFDEVKGFDETMIIAGSDVALCLSLYEKGYKNIYWPFAKLYHYENISVGTYDNGIIGDYNKSLEYYRPYLKWKDPYFNANLDLMNESIAIRSNYEETH